MATPGATTSSPPRRPSPSSSSTISSLTDPESGGNFTNGAGAQRDVEKGSAALEQGGVPARRVESARITRVQSISSRRAYDNTFSHPLAHVKTTQDVIVDFDSADDTYNPLNWPLRKKVVTTALYGLCTMVFPYGAHLEASTIH